MCDFVIPFLRWCIRCGILVVRIKGFGSPKYIGSKQLTQMDLIGSPYVVVLII